MVIQIPKKLRTKKQFTNNFREIIYEDLNKLKRDVIIVSVPEKAYIIPTDQPCINAKIKVNKEINKNPISF